MDLALRVVVAAKDNDLEGFTLELEGMLEPSEVRIAVTPERNSARHHVLNVPHVFGKIEDVATPWHGYHSFIMDELTSRRVRSGDFEKPKRDGKFASEFEAKTMSRDDEYKGTPLHMVMGAPVHFNTINFVTKLVEFGGTPTLLVVDSLGNNVLEIAMVQCHLNHLVGHTLELFDVLYKAASAKLTQGVMRSVSARVVRRALSYNVSAEAIVFMVKTMSDTLMPKRIPLLIAVDRGAPELVHFLGNWGCPRIVHNQHLAVGAGHFAALACSWEAGNSEFDRRLAVLKVVLSFCHDDYLCSLHADKAWNGTVLHFALKVYADDPEALNPRMVDVLETLTKFKWVNARARNCMDKCPFCDLSDPQRRQLEGVRKRLIAKCDGSGGPCSTCDVSSSP